MNKHMMSTVAVTIGEKFGKPEN